MFEPIGNFLGSAGNRFQSSDIAKNAKTIHTFGRILSTLLPEIHDSVSGGYVRKRTLFVFALDAPSAQLINLRKQDLLRELKLQIGESSPEDIIVRRKDVQEDHQGY